MNLNMKILLFGVFLNTSLFGDVLIPEDQCALIVASRSTKAEVKDYVNNEISNSRYVTIYRANNGWYAIALGFLKDNEKRTIISRWKKSGKIPQDSFCAKSYKFQEEINIDFSKRYEDSSTKKVRSYSSYKYSSSNSSSMSKSFINAINSFNNTGDMTYLRRAGKLANSRKEDLIVEKLLLENTPLKKIFSIQDISTSSKGEYHNLVEENIPLLNKISEISTSTKKINKKFKLSANSKMVGNYKVNVKFTVTTTLNAETVNDDNWLGKLYNVAGAIIPQIDKRTYTQKFYINRNNNFTDTKTVSFNLMNVSIGALGIRANTKVRSMDLVTEIVDVSPTN